MELLAPIVLDGALLGAIVLASMAAISALRRRHRSGVLFGAAGIALQMVFEWLWYSAFVRPEDGRNWLELAFARANTFEIVILTCGLLVTLVNALLLIRQKTFAIPAAKN